MEDINYFPPWWSQDASYFSMNNHVCASWHLPSGLYPATVYHRVLLEDLFSRTSCQNSSSGRAIRLQSTSYFKSKIFIILYASFHQTLVLHRMLDYLQDEWVQRWCQALPNKRDDTLYLYPSAHLISNNTKKEIMI